MPSRPRCCGGDGDDQRLLPRFHRHGRRELRALLRARHRHTGLGAIPACRRAPARRTCARRRRCGTGTIARAAVRAGCSVTGIDVAPDMIDVATSLETPSSQVEWHVGDAQLLRFDDGTFDVVTCQMGLMFLEDRAQARRRDATGARPRRTGRRQHPRCRSSRSSRSWSAPSPATSAPSSAGSCASRLLDAPTPTSWPSCCGTPASRRERHRRARHVAAAGPGRNSCGSTSTSPPCARSWPGQTRTSKKRWNETSSAPGNPSLLTGGCRSTSRWWSRRPEDDTTAPTWLLTSDHRARRRRCHGRACPAGIGIIHEQGCS